MNGTRIGSVLLSGLLVLLGGCACCQYCTQVSSFFVGASAGDVHVQGVATPQEAQVLLQGRLTALGCDVQANASPGNDRFVLDGKTSQGKPFRIVLTSADNGRGSQVVKAKLEGTGGDLVEVRALLRDAPENGTANKK